MAQQTGQPVAGAGTEFRRWDSDGGSWEKVAWVNSISGPDASRETIETTSLDATDKYRTFIAGFRDSGSISLSMTFTREEYDIMKGDFEDDIAKNYEMILPDADNTSLEFEGLVTECPLEVPADDKLTMEISIKISGKVTVASGSGSSPG